jgi:hypothetical protein
VQPIEVYQSTFKITNKQDISECVVYCQQIAAVIGSSMHVYCTSITVFVMHTLTACMLQHLVMHMTTTHDNIIDATVHNTTFDTSFVCCYASQHASIIAHTAILRYIHCATISKQQ